MLILVVTCSIAKYLLALFQVKLLFLWELLPLFVKIVAQNLTIKYSFLIFLPLKLTVLNECMWLVWCITLKELGQLNRWTSEIKQILWIEIKVGHFVYYNIAMKLLNSQWHTIYKKNAEINDEKIKKKIMPDRT